MYLQHLINPKKSNFIFCLVLVVNIIRKYFLYTIIIITNKKNLKVVLFFTTLQNIIYTHTYIFFILSFNILYVRN